MLDRRGTIRIAFTLALGALSLPVLTAKVSARRSVRCAYSQP
jgi:hypothetical protein